MLLVQSGLQFTVLAWVLAARTGFCQLRLLSQFTIPPPPWKFCGVEGWLCCTPSFPTSSIFGPIVSCGTGLGCDINSGFCTSPCGTPGEVCCDGPDTNALRWDNTQKTIFSPPGPWLKEMCPGASCDRASHRCVACVSNVGTPCCPPDASSAIARCIGPNLQCQFSNPLETSGICISCGHDQQTPCSGNCDPGLKLRNGFCALCGKANQIACDVTENPCNFGCELNLLLVNGMCLPCGDVGQPPCGVPATSCINNTPWYHCKQGLGMRQGLCQLCGSEGQSPCDTGCRTGPLLLHGLCTALCGRQNQEPCDNNQCLASLQAIENLCEACGGTNLPPCPRGGCTYPLKIRRGLCAQCGAENQLPCDIGCNADLLPRNGLCSSQCGLEAYPPCDHGCRDGRTVNSVGLCVGPSACAGEGEACVYGDFGTTGQGLTCCAPGGPFVCVWGICRRCIPHGEVVPLGGTQICCDIDDTVVLDQASGETVCGIGDADLPDEPS